MPGVFLSGTSNAGRTASNSRRGYLIQSIGYGAQCAGGGVNQIEE
jgi:hypothetical protein